MFKKVFISLLILSALSAEGAINPSIDIYNIYFSYASLLDACDEQLEAIDAMAQDASDFVMLSESERNEILAYTATISSSKNIQLRNQPADFIMPVFYSLAYSAKYYSNETTSQSTKRVIISKSDSSPPCLSV